MEGCKQEVVHFYYRDQHCQTKYGNPVKQ